MLTQPLSATTTYTPVPIPVRAPDTQAFQAAMQQTGQQQVDQARQSQTGPSFVQLPDLSNLLQSGLQSFMDFIHDAVAVAGSSLSSASGNEVDRSAADSAQAGYAPVQSPTLQGGEEGAALLRITLPVDRA